jgi:hypothetical protein
VDAENDLEIFQTEFGGAEGPFLKAIDSVRLPNGQIVCRVNADAITTNDDPACVPLNPFGQGAPSAAALDYVQRTSELDGNASQFNVLGFVGGDSSQLFEFPGGPARFVVGGEYRREEAFQSADALSSAGATFFNAFQVFDPPPFEVIEAFGELELPLLRDVPFAHELSVTGAARYSDYNTAVGSTFAWNVNGTWAPIRDLRFRANFSRAVRVPTIGDLFTPSTQSFAFLGDPCDVQNRNGGRTQLSVRLTAMLQGSPPTSSIFRHAARRRRLVSRAIRTSRRRTATATRLVSSSRRASRQACRSLRTTTALSSRTASRPLLLKRF